MSTQAPTRASGHGVPGQGWVAAGGLHRRMAWASLSCRDSTLDTGLLLHGRALLSPAPRGQVLPRRHPCQRQRQHRALWAGRRDTVLSAVVRKMEFLRTEFALKIKFERREISRGQRSKYAKQTYCQRPKQTSFPPPTFLHIKEMN